MMSLMIGPNLVVASLVVNTWWLVDCRKRWKCRLYRVKMVIENHKWEWCFRWPWLMIQIFKFTIFTMKTNIESGFWAFTRQFEVIFRRSTSADVLGSSKDIQVGCPRWPAIVRLVSFWMCLLRKYSLNGSFQDQHGFDITLIIHYY